MPDRLARKYTLTGMFSVYTFVTRPDLFNAYIAASPYLQYDKGVVVKKAAELISRNSIKNKTLYLSLGNEPNYLESMGKFTGLLNELDVPGLEWKYVKFDNDNHASVPHKTLYQGL